MRSRKLRKRFERDYGQKPAMHYFDGDMQGIRAYFDYRADNRLDGFLMDDTTWNDLSGDDAFKRINQGLSTSGEQYLYYLLRSPSIERGEYEKRAKLIAVIGENPELRLKLQVILSKLGRRRAAKTCEAFKPSAHSLKKMFLYVFLLLALVGSAISIAFTMDAFILTVGLCIFNSIFHYREAGRISGDLATVNYSVSMVYAAKKIKKLPFPGFEAFIAPLCESLKRLKTISRIGFAQASNSPGDVMELLNFFLLLDLIMYELLKNRLGRHHEDIFKIHEYLGRIDSAIAISSYRKSLRSYAIPDIDFTCGGGACMPCDISASGGIVSSGGDISASGGIVSSGDNSSSCGNSLPGDNSSPGGGDARIHYCGIGLVHPLIEDAVPNDFDTSRSVLLTGSNASGKSTFLKAVALNAIFAQAICTALCERYSATAFRIYSSMAIADNILAGESYFISEIKSLKRIVTAAAPVSAAATVSAAAAIPAPVSAAATISAHVSAAAAQQPLLCVIDEILRGTNTIERIAASSELLRHLSGGSAICLAATHDIELCSLLDGCFRMFHFEETVTEDDGIMFDYTMKAGPATTRNAIKLLGIMGFDRGLVSRANERANKYISEGRYL